VLRSGINLKVPPFHEVRMTHAPRAIAVISLLCVFFAPGWAVATPVRMFEEPLQAFFNHEGASGPIESSRGRGHSDADVDFAIPLRQSIDAARSSIDMAVQELHLPDIAKALGRAKARGVRVRVVLENTYSGEWSRHPPQSADTDDEDGHLAGKMAEFRALVDADGDGVLSPEEISQGDAIVILHDAGIPIVDDTEDGSRGSGLMHHKFVVVDAQDVHVTSANFTNSDFYGDLLAPETSGNANAYVRLRSERLAHAFTEEFEYLWGDGPRGAHDSRFGIAKPWRAPVSVDVGDARVTVQFGGVSVQAGFEASLGGLIARTLAAARSTVDFALFVFSEQHIADTLRERVSRGVRVRGLVEPSFATRSYSEVLDLWGVDMPDERCAYEQGNAPWFDAPQSQVGIPALAEGDKLHHKMAVVDGSRVLFGSHNWSAAATAHNDETLLVIEHAPTAARFTSEFERLRARASFGPPAWLLRRIDDAKALCRRRSAAP
jgi:phosphatidylserine/phosphatidylglycerophosphate/cardiolipin synthase-like enzyme